jgi:PAS domain S-box-containing protein
MQSALLPPNEAARLAKLYSLGILDTLPQKAFDDITALASSICGTPMALITLIDQDRQWFKSRVGIDDQQTDREIAFCSHAILQPTEVMVVEDASQDQRFHDNPLVQNAPNVRFYAGAPIVTDDGFAMGTVCVADSSVRHLQPDQLQALRSLSSLVVTLLEHEKLVQAEHHRHREELVRYNEYLAAVTASGLDLMAFIDPDLIYRYVNPTYLKYWGRATTDIVDHKVIDLLGPELFAHSVEPRLRQALAGKQIDFEATVDFTALGKRHVAVTYLPARNIDGSIGGVVVRTHDITAMKQHEEQLRETVAMLEHKTLEQERFIHIISHDLREPINTINNFSSLLAEDEDLSLQAPAQRYLRFVQEGGKRMALLLDDLLNFVQLEQHAIELKPVDLDQIVEEVKSDLNSLLVRSGGTVNAAPLPSVVGDASLLRIVLQNLMSNALKFADPKTPPIVQLTSHSDNEFVYVCVADNGIGIPPDKLNSVFDMFKRLHSSKAFKGAGLGLSICRRVAELHGGSVSATSVMGEGSCFTLALPTNSTTQTERPGHETL